MSPVVSNKWVNYPFNNPYNSPGVSQVEKNSIQWMNMVATYTNEKVQRKTQHLSIRVLWSPYGVWKMLQSNQTGNSNINTLFLAKLPSVAS